MTLYENEIMLGIETAWSYENTVKAGARVHFPIILMNRLNKSDSAVFKLYVLSIFEAMIRLSDYLSDKQMITSPYQYF